MAKRPAPKKRKAKVPTVRDRLGMLVSWVLTARGALMVGIPIAGAVLAAWLATAHYYDNYQKTDPMPWIGKEQVAHMFASAAPEAQVLKLEQSISKAALQTKDAVHELNRKNDINAANNAESWCDAYRQKVAEDLVQKQKSDDATVEKNLQFDSDRRDFWCKKLGH
jgi:hypothetical protein